jgi:hypothetical protein
MVKIRSGCFVAALAVVLVFPAVMQSAEMTSASYVISSTVMSGGGVVMTSTNYRANGTLGQPSPLMNPTDPPVSISYNLQPGFWYTLEMEPIDLCEGDFDDDLDVDGSDLATFAADFGRTDCASGPLCEGDFDNDNDVDGSDLATFAADFGRTDCP